MHFLCMKIKTTHNCNVRFGPQYVPELFKNYCVFYSMFRGESSISLKGVANPIPRVERLQTILQFIFGKIEGNRENFCQEDVAR